MLAEYGVTDLAMGVLVMSHDGADEDVVHGQYLDLSMVHME